MILKLNGQYLDFNADIDIEKKVKLFEEIDSADGDVSYEFEIPLTSENLAILGPLMPDAASKTVYSENDCEVLNDDGSLINRGSLRVERANDFTAYCSFLGGNSNWFAAISGNMTELRLSQYDTDINQSNIVSSWSSSDGITFPLIDTGTLISRGYFSVKTEDFFGCFFVSTLIKEIFQQSGIKIQGELLDDWLYKNTLIAANNRNVNDIINNSFFISSDIPLTALPTSDNTIQFNVLTGDYFLGDYITTTDEINFYVTTKMVCDITVKTKVVTGGTLSSDPYLNGVRLSLQRERYEERQTSNNITNGYSQKIVSLQLDVGDYLRIDLRNNFGYSLELESISFKLEPKYLYKAYGSSSVPLWSKQQFVSNIFSIFNVIPVYDALNKTLTVNLFDKIKEKEPIDISEFIQIDDADYSEFISNYAKSNLFSYSDPNDENLTEYNIGSYIKYGSGVIESSNQYVDKERDVVKSEFTSPISYINDSFAISLERINFIELEKSEERSITSVSNSSGVPQFNITDADDYFKENDLVTLDTTVDEYNGDYVVSSVASGYIRVWGLDYTSDATGTAVKGIHKSTDDENVYIFAKTKYDSISKISRIYSGIYIDQTFITFSSLAYFNLLRNGATAENIYKQGLSFGSVNNPLSFQKSILDKYWRQFGRILNDPVMLKATGYLPLTVYNRLDFLHPVTVRTKQTSNLYYVNRISGYKNSYTPCELELIKLP